MPAEPAPPTAPPDPSQVGRLCAELLDLYRRDTGGMTDDERDAFLDRRDRLTWLLTQLPAQTPAHTAAKLTILCHRLRHELEPGCVPMPVTDYLLAESARGDVEGWPRRSD